VLTFELDSSLTRDQIVEMSDEFVTMIESRNLQYGGGGIHTWNGVVSGPWRGTATNDDRIVVVRWLLQHPKVLGAHAGPLRDAWHGWN